MLTLMRHVLVIVGDCTLLAAPATRTCDMIGATSSTARVALRGFTLTLAACSSRAGSAAIALAAVAVRADQYQHQATSANEEAGRVIGNICACGAFQRACAFA